jgi:hypothetical protein
MYLAKQSTSTARHGIATGVLPWLDEMYETYERNSDPRYLPYPMKPRMCLFPLLSCLPVCCPSSTVHFDQDPTLE